MGRRISVFGRRAVLWICLIFLCLIRVEYNVCAAQEEEEGILRTADVLIDQVDVRMPEIRLCIGGNEGGNVSMEQVSVYRNEEKLENVSLQALAEATEESCIYLLLDVSRSVPQAEFEAAREQLLKLYESRAETERIVLVTFGDEIRVALDGNETAEEAKEHIAALERDSQNTKLFDGIKKVTELAAQEQAEHFVRKALIVITDGMDEGLTGDTTQQEALRGLAEQGIAVYGMVNRNGEKEAAGRFGEFARMTGGEMLLWEAAKAGEVMDGLLESIRSARVLTVRSDSNIVSYQTETLTVVFEPWNLKREVSAYIGRWIPDQEPPRVVSAEQEDGSHLMVAFSEPVEGMDTASNYQLKAEEGLTVPVSIEKLDSERVRLVFGEDFYQGSYELTFINMTDVSMEKNPLEQNIEMELTGKQREEAQEAEDETGLSPWVMGLLLFTAAVLIAAMGAAYFLKLKKKNGQAQRVEEETVCTEAGNVRKHVVLKKEDGLRINFYPKNAGNKGQAISYLLHGSAIIGRSDICDVYFDDALMSRQHFALEYEQGDLFITDLEAANGTFVNGVRIKGRRKLQKDDVVSAGSMDLMLRGRKEKDISC